LFFWLLLFVLLPLGEFKMNIERKFFNVTVKSIAVVKQADHTTYCLFTSFVDTKSTFHLHTEPLVAQCAACIFDSLSHIRHFKVISAICFSLHFVAKRYILQQKCLKKLIGSCLLGTRRYNC